MRQVMTQPWPRYSSQHWRQEGGCPLHFSVVHSLVCCQDWPERGGVLRDVLRASERCRHLMEVVARNDGLAPEQRVERLREQESACRSLTTKLSQLCAALGRWPSLSIATGTPQQRLMERVAIAELSAAVVGTSRGGDGGGGVTW